MKAVRIVRPGGPEELALAEVPDPEPGPGQALVRIEAAGVNFIDIYQRKGQYGLQLPATLGSEAAGVVEAIGPTVTEVKPGDRVAYTNVLGAYAERAVVPAERLVPLPEGISTQIAAASLLQGMTAHYLVMDTFSLDVKDVALIHAASGGVGHLLVQAARIRGARVIATVGTEEKAQLAREAGANYVINYTRKDFVAETRSLTFGNGVNVVYDSVGKDTFMKSLDCIRRRGYMVLFGQASGPVPPFDPQILNAKGSLFLTRPTLGDYIHDRVELIWRANHFFNWILEGKLHVRIDQTLPLERAGEAHRYLEERKSRGKVLLVP